MYKVKHKFDDTIHVVYGLNGTHFLLYDLLRGWYYDDIENYRPEEAW